MNRKNMNMNLYLGIVFLCLALFGCITKSADVYDKFPHKSPSLCVEAGAGENVDFLTCVRPISRCDDIPGDASLSLNVFGTVGAQVRIRLLCGGQEILGCTATSVIAVIGGSAPPPASTPGFGSCSDGPRDMVDTAGKLECDVARVPGTPAAGYVGSCLLSPPI